MENFKKEKKTFLKNFQKPNFKSKAIFPCRIKYELSHG